MRTINSFILLCVFCLFCQPTLAQRRVRLADLPPFERAVVVVKYFEGMHTWKNYPYVGYGHQLQPGERFTADMTEWQADSLLRADLWKCFDHFKGYGKYVSFCRYKGKFLRGLVKRRKVEFALFFII